MARRTECAAVLLAAALLFAAGPEALAAEHVYGPGAGGADYCTVWNYPYNMYTRFGPVISSHYLVEDGEILDAFCLDPYLECGSGYEQGGWSAKWYEADLGAAAAYVCMYLEGLPEGFSDRVRKAAVQMAVFQTSQLGTDYAPPNKNTFWYSLMFEGSDYARALEALWQAAEDYRLPGSGGEPGEPMNIRNVRLTLRPDGQTYEADVYAGPEAAAYDWSGYARLEGERLHFAVPAEDVAAWTGRLNGCPYYESEGIRGEGEPVLAPVPEVWTGGETVQPLLTVKLEERTPVNTVRYSLYADGADEGLPGGGGGVYGGRISSGSAMAGGGSGMAGEGTRESVLSGEGSGTGPPDGSRDGYVRITLAE